MLFKIFIASATLLASVSSFAQSGDDIINKHIDAVGGEKKLNAVTTLKVSGKMNVQGMEFPTSRTLANDRGFRMDFSVMGQNCWMLMTPNGGWMYMPIQPGMSDVQEIPAEQVKNSKSRFTVKGSLMADKSIIKKATYVGTETIDNIPCHKVNITGLDGIDQVCYFDTKDYYLIRTEANMTAGDEEQKMAINYGNFKKLPEGIVIPMKESNPIMGGDFIYTDVEVNKPIADDVFKPITTGDIKSAPATNGGK